MPVRELYKGDLEGDLEVDLEGDCKGDFRGTSNRTWKGTCCQAKVRSGQAQVRSSSGYSSNLIL